MKLLAQNTDIWGTINPPISSIPVNPVEAFGKLISAGIILFIFVSSIALLIYMLLGAYGWLVSGGEKERLTKAQQKITNAVVGMLVIIVVLVIYCVITTNILHLTDNCFYIKIPHLVP